MSIHRRELKVRLSDQDYELLKQLAHRAGVPPAVLGRMWIKSRIQSIGLNSRINCDARGRPSQGLSECRN